MKSSLSLKRSQFIKYKLPTLFTRNNDLKSKRILGFCCACAEQKVTNLPFSPKMFGEGLFVDFATCQHANSWLFSKKVEDNCSQNLFSFFKGQEFSLCLIESSLKLSFFIKGKQTLQIDPIDVLLATMLNFSHNSIVLFYFFAVSFEECFHQHSWFIRAQERKGLIDDVRFRVFLFVRKARTFLSLNIFHNKLLRFFIADTFINFFFRKTRLATLSCFYFIWDLFRGILGQIDLIWRIWFWKRRNSDIKILLNCWSWLKEWARVLE